MLDLDGSTLLIHHWDTDGLCSAAIILDQFNGDMETWTPPLGTFSLTQDEIAKAQGYKNVIICDMALPVSNVKSVAKKSKVIIFDHHHQKLIEEVEHINPVARGANGEAYPSTTWVIKERFGLQVSLRIILGFVGDWEQRIKESPLFWEITQRYLKDRGMDFDDLLELVYRIDSNYKVGDRIAVMKAPQLLRKYNNRADIMSNDKWKQNLQKLDDKLDTVLSEPPEIIDGVQVKRLDTPYAIISQVTRRLAWDSGSDTIVVNTGFFDDQDQLYSRSLTVDMYHLIERAKKKGYNAGGKKDVIGAIIPKAETEKFLVETIEYLKKNR